MLRNSFSSALMICFLGGPLLYVLRESKDPEQFRLIGQSVVHGLIKGKTVEMECLKVQEITLI